MSPIRNQILFKPFLSEEITKFGLFVPDSCRRETDKGTIVAVGKGTKDNPMRFSVGDVVYRVHDWGMPVEKNGEYLYLMEDSAILAKV